MNDWKAPGPDMVHGYWIKALTSLHSRIAKQIQNIINQNAIPPELCKGRTVLIQKDINKGTTPFNYRPITCLLMIYKLITSFMKECTQTLIEMNNIMPLELKGVPADSEVAKITSSLFLQNIGLELGPAKCASATLIKGKEMPSSTLILMDNTTIRGLQPDETYKYLGVAQSTHIHKEEMRANVSKEYHRRVRKVVE